MSARSAARKQAPAIAMASDIPCRPGRGSDRQATTAQAAPAATPASRARRRVTVIRSVRERSSPASTGAAGSGYGCPLTLRSTGSRCPCYVPGSRRPSWQRRNRRPRALRPRADFVRPGAYCAAQAKIRPGAEAERHHPRAACDRCRYSTRRPSCNAPNETSGAQSRWPARCAPPSGCSPRPPPRPRPHPPLWRRPCPHRPCRPWTGNRVTAASSAPPPPCRWTTPIPPGRSSASR